MTKYAGVYGGPLNSNEQADVGRFAAQLIKAAAAGDGTTVVTMIKEAAASVTDVDDYVALMGMLEHLEKEGSAGYRRALLYSLPIIAAGLSAVPAIASTVQHLGRRKRIETSRETVLQENPSLRDDGSFDRYFDTVTRFAPDVAADPLIAGNIMVEMHRLGPAAMTPTRINDLLGLQGRVGDARQVVPGQIAEIGSGLDGAAKSYTSMHKEFNTAPNGGPRRLNR